MPKKHTFVISDESVLNSYGFRVITDGIDISRYDKNPIVLWMHKRPTMWDNKNDKDKEILPIGLASNLRKEDGKLYADIEFDENDEFAQKIEEKVMGGFIRMCSPGLDPVALTDEEQYLLPGQTHMTLLKSNLEEISIADIGSNPNALKLALYSPDGLVKLSKDNVGDFIPKLKLSNTPDTTINLNNTNSKSMDFMKQVAVLLAMNPDASQESIMEALKGKIELANKSATIQLAHDQLADQLKTINHNSIIALVDANVDKKITADKREQMIQLGKDSGMDTLKNVLDMMPTMTKPGDVITLGNNGGGSQKIEKFEDLLKLGKEAVEKYRTENREDYIRLYKGHYGTVPAL